MVSRILMTVMCITCPTMSCTPLVSVPDPNQPQRIALAIYTLDERSGNETSINLVLRVKQQKVCVPGSIANERVSSPVSSSFPFTSCRNKEESKIIITSS